MAHAGQPPDDDEVRVGDDIDEVLSRANPNPERVRCPPRETLIGLARRVQPLGDPAYEHLVKCSPCYREFRALQENAPPQSARRTSWPTGRLGAAAAAILVAGLAATWFYRADRPSRSQPPTASQSQVAELRAELDLRKYSVLRSEQGGGQPDPVSLPSGVVEITLLLPVGSEPGPYDIQLLDSDLKSTASAHAVGEIRDFVTTVRATLDLRAIPSGTYQLAVRREGDDWRMFPARLK
jgi:hypothetical protein